MQLPYANPVISAAVLPDDDLCGVYEMCRKIHKDVQAGEKYPDAVKWEPKLVYLMMIGDCMAREIVRRDLKMNVNLILQHPQEPFPDYWKTIIVPEWLNDIVEWRTDEVWGPDMYPAEAEEASTEEEAVDA